MVEGESNMSGNEMHGQCLCGAVTLRTSAAGRKVSACHCGMCRTWGGGPFFSVECGANLAIDGEQHVSIFSSSKWAERGFCRECGTHIFYRMKGNGHYAIPAGLLAQQEQLELATQLFIDSKPGWYGFSNVTRDLTSAEAFALYEE